MEKVEFDTENVINAVYNETVLWNTIVNAPEEEKELAWKRIADLFGQPNG